MVRSKSTLIYGENPSEKDNAQEGIYIPPTTTERVDVNQFAD